MQIQNSLISADHFNKTLAQRQSCHPHHPDTSPVSPGLRRQISRTVKVQIQKHSFLKPKSNVSSSSITEESGHLEEHVFR